MTENRFWNLLAKKLSGDASLEELQELETLLKLNPQWIYAADIIESLWKSKDHHDPSFDSELAFEQHIDQLKEKGINFTDLQTPVYFTDQISKPILTRKKSYLLFGLSTIVILVLVFFLRSNNTSDIVTPPPQKFYSEVSTRLGSKSKLILPDSSVVYLNAGSKLTYDKYFGSANRNATLSGEAYFDVKKSTVPFIIHANGLQIKVLGTAFNVKSYPNEKTTETSLIRGRVEITNTKRPGEVFILNPNEKLIISNELKEEKTGVKHKIEPKVVKGALTVTADNTVVETSWVENKLIFQDESFEEVARKMERWYNVRIEIKDEELGKLNVGGGPFENETIQQALVALQIAFQFKFTMNDNYIIITR